MWQALEKNCWLCELECGDKQEHKENCWLPSVECADRHVHRSLEHTQWQSLAAQVHKITQQAAQNPPPQSALDDGEDAYCLAVVNRWIENRLSENLGPMMLPQPKRTLYKHWGRSMAIETQWKDQGIAWARAPTYFPAPSY